MLTPKDFATLINKPNKALAEITDCRVRIEDATPAMIDFYRDNASEINGIVVILESKNDDAHAAKIRNSCQGALFIFSETYSPYGVTAYFSGTTDLVLFPKALIKRSLEK